jgi:hypothetical protein
MRVRAVAEVLAQKLACTIDAARSTRIATRGVRDNRERLGWMRVTVAIVAETRNIRRGWSSATQEKKIFFVGRQRSATRHGAPRMQTRKVSRALDSASVAAPRVTDTRPLDSRRRESPKGRGTVAVDAHLAVLGGGGGKKKKRSKKKKPTRASATARALRAVVP